MSVPVMNSARFAIYCTFTLTSVLLANCKTVELFGAGASFPSVVYTQWLNLYRQERVQHVDVYMKYDSIGSGEGKARVKGEQLPDVHYAGSDTRLTEAEVAAFPDLIQFPTLAGAIVMAYNIPGLQRLNLNYEAVVGIYNGTIKRWDDPVIVNLNPASNMPMTGIVVIARADKSGTTDAFTSGLSAYSTEWKNTYGVFSEGRDKDTRLPVKWKNGTVKLFGNTNQGMSGLILSIDYALGYVAIANAQSSGMNYATLKNSAGNLINATVQTVQNAIISANGSYDIMNTPGTFAYPLASFTYFIVKMSTLEDCDAAVEFVRYVRWFYSSEQAHEQAIRLYMVPLDSSSAAAIENDLLKLMTCRGRNVWQMMLEQIEQENANTKDKDWQIPTFLCLCLVIAASTGLFVHLGRQQILLHRELLKDSWKIDSSTISLDRGSLTEDKKNGSASFSNRDTLDEGMVFIGDTCSDALIFVGVLNENPITLVRMHKQSFELSMAEKKTLIRMRESIKHPNVMQLLGITKLNGYWSNVHAGLIRGSLSDILQSKRIEINTDGIIALSKSLVKGLLYLHKKGIVHGHLNGMCCVIDTSWELKIAAWTEPKLETSIAVDRNRVSNLSDRSADDNKFLLWTAPELVKFKRRPNQASDVYSLCMVFQEMYTRREPYSELSMTNTEVINAVLTCGIRPQLATETPLLFKAIMERSWDVDPAGRPKLDVILNSIKAAFPVNHSFLDCIIRSIELYARQLEGRVKDQEDEIKGLSEKTQACVYQNVPTSIADMLKAKTKVETEEKDSLCILVCNITNMELVIRHSTPKGIINLLNNFYSSLDQVLLHDDVFRLSRYAGQSICVVGLQKLCKYRDERKVVTEAVRIALKLNSCSETFKRERLIGMNAEVKLQIGVASGTVILGVMGSLVPDYTALGSVVDEALELSRNANPSEIRISARVNALLNEKTGVKTCTWETDDGVGIRLRLELYLKINKSIERCQRDKKLVA